MNKKPFFSVVICTYNGAKTLPRALKSLQAQTFKDFECIIIDDGSTDSTKSLLKKYPWVKYAHQKNKGLGAARNTGVIKSQGQFITFLDSDDKYEPKHLEVRRKFILRFPRINLFYNGYKVIGYPYVPDKDDPTKLIHIKYCVLGATFVFKRKVFNAIGGFKNLHFAEDSDFFDRVKKRKFKSIKIKNKTYVYYHNNSKSLTAQVYKNALKKLNS